MQVPVGTVCCCLIGKKKGVVECSRYKRQVGLDIMEHKPLYRCESSYYGVYLIDGVIRTASSNPDFLPSDPGLQMAELNSLLKCHSQSE